MKKLAFILFSLIWILPNATPVQADDADLFVSQVPPDALILLDLSGSMNWDPEGNPAPVGGRRVDIAKNVLFDLLDDDDNGQVNTNDEKSLNNIRFGYMRFTGSTSTNNDSGVPDPMRGSNVLVAPIGSRYNDIWNGIKDATASGGTPLAAALAEAKVYFEQYVNPADNAIKCRKKYVILITDGSDTWACSGNGLDDEVHNPGMYKRRMLTVQRAKELNEAGIKVFAVGFGGNFPDRLKRTLNWVARYGGLGQPPGPEQRGPRGLQCDKICDAIYEPVLGRPGGSGGPCKL